MSDRLHGIVESLVAENEALRSALAELVKRDPIDESDAASWCAYCDAMEVDGSAINHADGCPYFAAASLLDRKGEA